MTRTFRILLDKKYPGGVVDEGTNLGGDILVREKVSVTIEQELVEWIDERIETKRFRNRSHAIEWALDKVVRGRVVDEGSYRPGENP
ncbi:hypothetical protein AKJ45_03090 [candidate division MSBL1 archaeon SCGC-AAA261F19]|uniref:Ribbon-helix-helix protein CopG domain-containing protein n=1 Tax=candidate division MSBL1 archaeon SCGC-AAA261F19 TaxID=1698275 RepID=A0A133V923_9EURY|nr:hypothetical protein AKJ45_03090 [candidate division MSBL1 archaeon SCGC-AAA261F19]